MRLDKVLLLGFSWTLRLGLLFMPLLPGKAIGETTPAAPASRIAYDIPAQSLGPALKDYAEATGVQVLFEAALAAGRRSAGVEGMLAPDDALLILLTGSGLVSRRTDVDAFTILPMSGAAAAIEASIPADAHFFGALQAGILDALCRREDTRPGTYRAALQFWIAPNGNVQRATLLASTGNPRRDAAVANVLATMGAYTFPPARMPQPVTMIVAPQSLAGGDECNSRRRP